MPIEQFNPVFRPQVAPVDLNTLGQAYNKLEQGHQAAIETASAVQTQLAQLDLNEAEDAWRQEQINDINNVVKDNSSYGNAYTALDDIVKSRGRLMSNPGMLGRLRAQQDYKKYQAELDSSNIPEEYKQYYRESNTYNYSDTKDKNGRVIGGSKWQPTDRAVNVVPMNQILIQALSWAAKEAGGSDRTRWLDAAGKPTDDYSKSVTGEYFDHSTSSWQRLSKDKLAASVKAVIESTPGAKASLEQDYKIAKWKYDKNGANPDITDKNGVIMNPDEYLNKRIDPFYKAATYYNQTSSTQYGGAVKAQLEMRAKQAAAAAASKPLGNPDLLKTNSNPSQLDNFMPAQAQSEINSGKQTIANALRSANPNLDFNLDKMTDAQIKSMIDSTVKSPRAKKAAYDAMQNINDANDYINSLTTGKDAKDVDKFKAYNAILGMGDLPENNYTKKYNGFVNKMFGAGTAIRQHFDNEDKMDAFVNAVGSKAAAEKLGIKFGTSNGKRYAELPKDNVASMYSFAKGVTLAHDSQSALSNAWSSLKGGVWSSLGDNLTRVGSNGEEEPITPGNVGSRTLERSAYTYAAPVLGNIVGAMETSSQGYNTFKDLVHYVDKDLKKGNDRIIDGGILEVNQPVIAAASPAAAEIKYQMKANPEAASKLKTVLDINEDEVKGAARHIDLTQFATKVVGENNKHMNVESKELRALTSRLRNADNSDIDVQLTQDARTGRLAPMITIKGQKGKDAEYKEPITFYVPDGFDDETIQSWNRNTSFRATNDVGVYSAARRPLPVTNGTAFAGIDRVTLYPNGQSFTVMNKTTNKQVGTISKEAAVELRDSYNMMNDLYNSYASGVINDAAAASIINKVATTISATVDGTVAPENVQYYREVLSNNLIGK